MFIGHEHKLQVYDLDTGAHLRTYQPDGEYVGGIWSDGETIWVGSWHLYAYDLETWERRRSGDITRGSWAGGIRGLAGHDGVLYAGVGIWRHVERIDLNDKSRSRSCNLPVDVLTGIWSDGTLLWIAAYDPGNPGDSKMIAMDMATCEVLPGFTLRYSEYAGSPHARGIWSNGETLWIADSEHKKIYAFTMP